MIAETFFTVILKVSPFKNFNSIAFFVVVILATNSSAKITYYLGELVKQGRVSKELVKGTNTYTALAEEETEEV